LTTPSRQADTWVVKKASLLVFLLVLLFTLLLKKPKNWAKAKKFSLYFQIMANATSQQLYTILTINSLNLPFTASLYINQKHRARALSLLARCFFSLL